MPLPTSDSKRESGLGASMLRGSAWTLSSSLATLLLGLIRAVLLARLLDPQDFGVAVLALFFLEVALQLQDFGLESAYVQDASEEYSRTLFIMRSLLLLAGLGLYSGSALIIAGAYPEWASLRDVMWGFAAVGLLRGLNGVQEAVLRKQMRFAPIAVSSAVAAVAMTIVAPYLAWAGWGVWALVGERLSGGALRAVILWGRPSEWPLKGKWDGVCARRWVRFGGRIWAGGALAALLGRLDDLVIGTLLGGVALGIYSRAYEFSQYPQRVLGTPLFTVLYPAFARLKGEAFKEKLSQAFFRAASALVRAGGLIGVILFLSAEEWVKLLLGPDWLEMVGPFKVMTFAMWLTPVLGCANQMLVGVGHPVQVIKIRLLQILAMSCGLVLLCPRLGILGGAYALDAAVFLGTLAALVLAKQKVDFSIRALWLWPVLAVGVTVVAGWGLGLLVKEWWLEEQFVLKVLIGSSLYPTVLWVGERKRIWKLLASARLGEKNVS